MTRCMIGLLCASFVFAEAVPASAQVRRGFDRFRRRSSPSTPSVNPQTGERVNANHELAKSNAERAHQHGDYQRAVDLTSNVLAENPRDHVAFYIRAGSRIELGMRQEDSQMVRDGVGDAREAIRLKRTDNTLYYLPYLYGMSQLSELEDNKQHAEVAVQVAGQVIGSTGLSGEDKANLFYQRAFAHTRLGDHASAVADYESALEVDPKHLGALLGRADAYAAAGNRDEAIAAFDKAVEAMPKYPLVYNNRGMFRDQIGDLRGAVADFTKAAELSDAYFWSYTNRGFARLRLGESALAEDDFSRSLQSQPNQPTVHVLRGSARLAQGKLDAARQDFARAIELSPDDAEAHASLGFASYFSDDFPEARASFDKAVSLNAQMHHLAPWRYLTLLRLDMVDEAARLASERAPQAGTEPEWSDRLLAFLSGSIDQDSLLEQVDAADPELEKSQPCEAHYFIAERAAIDGDAEAAEQHYQKTLETKAYQLSAYRGAQFALEQFTPAGTDQAGLTPATD